MDQSAASPEEPKQTVLAPPSPPNLDTTTIADSAADVAAVSQPAPEVVVSELVTPIVAAPQKRRFPKLRAFVIVVLLLNVGLAAGNERMYVKQLSYDPKRGEDDRNLPTYASPSSKTELANKATPAAPSTVSTTLHYTSAPLKIEFDYPSDWHVSSSSDNSTIKLASAPFQFTAVGGKQTAATINIAITPVAKAAASFNSVNESDVIAANSETLQYTSPTKSQRSVTNVSFANDHGLKNNNILSAFISGDLVYKIGDVVGSKKFQSIDPQISMHVDDCASGTCQQALSADVFTISDWHDNANFQKVKALLASLRLN